MEAYRSNEWALNLEIGIQTLVGLEVEYHIEQDYLVIKP